MSSSMILVDMSDEKQNKTNIFNIKQNPNSILHVEKKKRTAKRFVTEGNINWK